MEKEKGWGASYPESLRNGEWEYQAYHANKKPFTEAEDSVTRCMSCHKSTPETDYVYSMDGLRSAKIN
ncbi:MAG: cytochrome P460 family protein [Burkholderiales bacterium]|nr:cytochrome P460 family protein [Burkholderiales bacterium]